MKPTTVAALCAASLVAGGVLAVSLTAQGAASTSATAATSATAGRAAGPDPATFARPGHNAFFPLRPGTVTRLRGSDEGDRFREVVTVTHRTKTIQGVRTRVLRDVVHRADGSLAEKTRDWYAADHDGTVWYFGEETATYDRHGHVTSREGSWRAGRRGARAGVIMPADPTPTDAYRQEYWAGHAEDQAWIVRRRGTVTVPYGRVRHVVRSYEWSRLEPHVVSLKQYAPGVGIVREQDVAGGHEVFELVSVSHR